MDELKQHLTAEELAIAVERLQIGQSLPEEFQRHLNRCASCKYELMTVLELSDVEEAPPKIKLGQNRNWMAVAAVAIILLAVGFYWVLSPSQDLPQKQLTQLTTETADTATPIKDSAIEKINKTPDKKPRKVVLAQANYTLNVDLEKLVARSQSQLRSAEANPVIVEKLGTGFHLSWKAAGVSIIEIFDNNGVLIFSQESDKQRIIFKPENPGLYYFKLISEDFDLLWCGKLEAR